MTKIFSRESKIPVNKDSWEVSNKMNPIDAFKTEATTTADRVEVTSYGDASRSFIFAPTTTTATDTATVTWNNTTVTPTNPALYARGTDGVPSFRVYMGTAGYNRFAQEEDNTPIEAMVACTCKNGHHYSLDLEEFEKPCPICGIDCRELGLERVSFLIR